MFCLLVIEKELDNTFIFVYTWNSLSSILPTFLVISPADRRTHFKRKILHGFYIGGSGDTVFNMEKLPQFNTEEDTEEWIEVFECRLHAQK